MQTKDLIVVLAENGLSEKEAAVYITSLQLGQAPVSTISRHLRENRVTVYSILKNLITKGVAQSSTKWKTTYYSMLDPQQLVEKSSQKLDQLKKLIPDLMALTHKIDSPVKTQFFEGLEGLKTVYKNIIMPSGDEMEPDESFLTFVGTNKIDPQFQHFLEKEFVPRRQKFTRPTQAIVSTLSTPYSKYHYDNYNAILVDDPVFDFANEIVLHGKDQVSICMYASHEMAALVIHSQTLHDMLKATFRIIRKMHMALHKKKGKFAKNG